jgi:predicted HAD superfamily Cof-like phosphohydrolase
MNMKSVAATPFADQAQFMQACGQSIDTFNARQVALYTGLQLEELGEKMRAFGLIPAAEQIETLATQFKRGMYDSHVEKADRLELFDADLDIAVVTAGSLLSAGSPVDAGWMEVHRSNMAKVDPASGKVIKDANGKVQKPQGWTKPDLGSVLAA